MTTALAPSPEVLADGDLLRLEAEVEDAEAVLGQELAQATGKAQEAAAHLAALQALPGASEAERVRVLSVPVFDGGTGRARLRQSREAALRLRREACAAVRASLDVFGAMAAEFEARLGQEEAALRAPVVVVPPAPEPPGEEEESALEAALLHAAATAPPHAELRKSERVALNVGVDFGSDSNFFAGFSTDISEGGLFIASVMHPPRGAVVELRFSILGDSFIEARGVVRWTREINDATPEVMPGAGIQFTELSPDAAAAIHEFIARREPLFFVD